MGRAVSSAVLTAAPVPSGLAVWSSREAVVLAWRLARQCNGKVVLTQPETSNGKVARGLPLARASRVAIERVPLLRAPASTRPSHAADSPCRCPSALVGPVFACACALSCTSSAVRCSGAPAAMDQRPASAHAAHSRASTAPTWLHQPQHSPQASRLSHLRRAHPCHICTGTGLTPAISAPGLGPPSTRCGQAGSHQPHDFDLPIVEWRAPAALPQHARARAYTQTAPPPPTHTHTHTQHPKYPASLATGNSVSGHGSSSRVTVRPAVAVRWVDGRRGPTERAGGRPARRGTVAPGAFRPPPRATRPAALAAMRACNGHRHARIERAHRISSRMPQRWQPGGGARLRVGISACTAPMGMGAAAACGPLPASRWWKRGALREPIGPCPTHPGVP